MSDSHDFQVYFPDGNKSGTNLHLFQAMKLAGMNVVENFDVLQPPDAAITWFHGRGRVPLTIHNVLKSLACPIIGIELPESGDRNDPIAILDLQLNHDTPFAAVAHAIRKQILLSRTLSSLNHLEKSIAQNKNKLDKVVELGLRLTRTLSHHELFQLVVDRAAGLLCGDVHVLFTIDGNEANCRMRALHQKPEQLQQKITPSFRIRTETRIALTECSGPIYSTAPNQEPPWIVSIASHFASARSLLVAPFVSKNHLLGFLIIAQFSNSAMYTPAEIERIEVLSTFSTVAIENAFVYDQAETLSRIDDLTGVYNFGFIQSFLDRLVSENESFSLVFIDLDGFKKINLMHGHTTGNKALRTAAGKIRDSLVASSLAGRFGGDEFVIVLPGVKAEEAKKTTEKIIQSIETVVIESDIRLSASAGIAEYPIDGDTLNSIIHSADTAMYAAKDRGRGHALLYKETSRG